MTTINKNTTFALAYDYAHQQGLVKSQKDLATRMGASESTVSKAIKGDPKSCTKNFCRRFNMECGMVFNLEYLFEGRGTMLANDKPQPVHKDATVASLTDALAIIERLRDENIKLRAQVEILKELQQKKPEVRLVAEERPAAMVAEDPLAIPDEPMTPYERHAARYKQPRTHKNR